MRRDTIIETANSFPTDIDLEVFMERLIFIDKVEKGRQQIREGKTVPHEFVKNMIKNW